MEEPRADRGVACFQGGFRRHSRFLEMKRDTDWMWRWLTERERWMVENGMMSFDDAEDLCEERSLQWRVTCLSTALGLAIVALICWWLL